MLEKQMVATASSQELDKWENSLHFTSLRAIAAMQSSRLEALDSQNQPTSEYDLMTKFGFPDFYAAIITPSGEYQIGNNV